MPSVLSMREVGPKRIGRNAYDLSCATWRCPSCAGGDTAYNTIQRRVECDGCGEVGPVAEDCVSAINAWNAWVLDKIDA